VQLGFVLDQGACIGCHACTVGCKAENDVPLGAFRTWVKWVEHGSFPDTRRSAAVLRCNHCADAPCIEICPTKALHKRPDGIVDLDRDRCIGCASCMQACPYDAIHIDERVGTAAKCHLCAHRIEVGLAPACVAVCPEQAIKVVDFDDPATRAELARRGAVARKPERRTRPRTLYLGADPATLDPLRVDGTRTLSHAEVPDPLPAPGNADARAVYDVPRKSQWGAPIAAYMTTKAVAAGALLGAALFPWVPALDPVLLGWTSLLAVLVTSALLIGDLHKPLRFFYLLTRPNTGSWLVRGGWILIAHGALSVPWALGLAGRVEGGPIPSLDPGVLGLAGPLPAIWLAAISAPVAVATAIYTAFLFWQARGRELWSEDRLLLGVLLLQAIAATAALAWLLGLRGPWLLAGLAAYPAMMLVATVLAPPTPHARLAHRLMIRHPAYATGLLAALGAVLFPPLLLVAFFALDWIYLRAGQQVALS
jgi:Fe-S-cluster-containing dehydrogenase component